MVVVGLPLSRALLDLAAVTTVGVSFLPKLLGAERPKRAAPVLAFGRLVAVFSSAIWLLAAIASLLFETADLNVGKPLTMAAIVDYVRQIASGQGLVIVACAALVYLVIAVVAVRRGEVVPAELRITVALFTLLPLPVTGHADSGTSWQDVNMISMELHVVGAVAWTGGLLAVILLVAANRTLLSFALPRYSRIATVCVFLTMVTGMFNGWLELYQTPGVHWYLALFTSGYGQILLLKGGCLARGRAARRAHPVQAAAQDRGEAQHRGDHLGDGRARGDGAGVRSGRGAGAGAGDQRQLISSRCRATAPRRPGPDRRTWVRGRSRAG